MTTILYPTSVTNAAALGASWTGLVGQFDLSTSSGSGVTSLTENVRGTALNASWLQPIGNNGVDANDLTGYAWVYGPVNAFTFTGFTTINLRGLESNAMANYGASLRVYKVTASVTLALFTSASASWRPTAEFTTSEAVYTGYTAPTLTNTSVASGAYLVVVLGYGTVSGVTSATGYTVTQYWNGTSAAASGDTWIEFTDNISIVAAAANPPPSKMRSYLPLIAQ